VSPAETLEKAAAAIGYDAFRREQPTARASGRHLGIGIGLYVEPQTTVATYKTEAVHMRIGPSGQVDVYIGSGDHGQGLQTTTAQLTAEFLAVPLASVTVHQGDTASTPFGPGTGGSRSGPMIGAVVRQAAATLTDKLKHIAAALLEAAHDDIVLIDGVLSVIGSPATGLSVAEVAAVAHDGAARLPPGTDVTLETIERFTAPPMMLSNACHMCTVEVDVTTGAVHILRYVVAEDCGQMINPAIVEGQIAGGVVQGIGGVLFEHNAYNAEGTPLASTLLDYLLPTASEVPDIEYVHIQTPGSTPGAYKGVGEGGAIGAPPAVFNAVADALSPLGVHLTRQPLDPNAIRAAIREATVRRSR
jgi:aerobic carbon-monoxide dehydrogenase large subunit